MLCLWLNSYVDQTMPVICETHGGRAIEYYCESDEVAICSQCALIGDHQGHQITTMEEKVCRIANQFSLFKLFPPTQFLAFC